MIEVATAEFAARGLHGTSTEHIAARAGISHPYLFRLFGTKKDLFIAVVERCFGRTLETFEDAAAKGRKDGSPSQAFRAMGHAYVELLADRNMLLIQLHAYAACDDPQIQAVVRRGYGEIFEFVESVSGANAEDVRRFFAIGMLLNVIAAMDLFRNHDEPWARRLVAPYKEGSKK